MNQLLYGAAYYDEYMPYERLEQDMELMKAAHINVIRIAESTWATEEPEEGVLTSPMWSGSCPWQKRRESP